MSWHLRWLRTGGTPVIRVMLLMLWCAAALAHDSPIDHVERTVSIYIEGGRVHVEYRFRCEERQVLLQMNEMDLNRDGKISDEERDASFAGTAGRLTKLLHLEVAGKALELKWEGPVRLGADLSQIYHFSASVGELAAGEHAGKFRDDFSRLNPGGYRWKPRQGRAAVEVDAVEAPGIEGVGGHPGMVVVNLKITVRQAMK